MTDERAYEEARELREHLTKMLDSEGWKLVRRFSADRADEFRQRIADTVLTKTDDVVILATLQGRMREARELPEIVEAIAADLTKFVHAYQQDPEDEKNV